MQTSSTYNITGKTVSGDIDSIVGNFEKLLLIGDTDNNKQLSNNEKETLSKFIDLNESKRVSQTELDLVSYIAGKDKTNGLSSKESDIVMLLKHLTKKYGIPITPENLTMLKKSVDVIDKDYDTPKWQNLLAQLKNERDLDGNKQIDPWEKHLGGLGISTSAEKLKLFTSAADSDKDGKVTEAEYNATKDYLDLNGDKKVTLNELKFFDTVTKLDGTAGLSEKEITAYKDVKKAVDTYQATNGTLELNNGNLATAIEMAKDVFNTHDFASNTGIDLDKSGKIEQWETDIAKQGISTSAEKLKLFTSAADSDKDGKVTEAEYNATKDYLDLNGDKKVTLNELKFFDTVTKLDGTAGLSEKEMTAYKDVKKAVDEHQAQYGTLNLNDQNLAIAINMAKDVFNTHDFASNTGIDLDKNGKIDDFEKNASTQYGINKQSTSVEQMVKIADADADGKVSEAEFKNTSKYLDLNGNKKADKLELELLEALSSFDGKNGIGSLEKMLADFYLAQDDNKVTDVFLSDEIKWFKDNKKA